MKRNVLKKAVAAGVFLVCAAMTGYYLIAGYGAYLDADMASELSLAQHLVQEGTLISPAWRYSTEVRVLSTQLVFAPLMALFPNQWRLVRTLGDLILLSMMAASAYFCARSLGAKRRYALVFSGLSISACSLVYSQMILIGAYYVPHAILTNLCAGLAARAVGTEKRRRGVYAAAFLALCTLMGASSIRYVFCAVLPIAAAGIWMFLFPGEQRENLARTREDRLRVVVTCLAALMSFIGYTIGQKLLGSHFLYDAVRYGGSRLAAFTANDLPALAQDALGGLVRLMGYREHSILISMHGMVSVGALMLPVLAAILAVRALRKDEDVRLGALTLLMSAALTAGTFLLVEGLYINRYWIPLMTLGAPVMAACLSREENLPLRRVSVVFFTGMVLVSSAMQIQESMASPEIGEAQKQRAAYLEENGLDFGYATFWNANVTTELTDGRVEVVAITLGENELGQAVPEFGSWLEAEENLQMNRPDEPIFLLLSADESDRLSDFLAACQAEKEAEHGGLGVWLVKTQRAFFEAMNAV